MVGVWNMDLSKENNKETAGIPQPGKFMKNSHEQWKHDFHRSFLGTDGGEITKHNVEPKLKDVTNC